MHFSAQVGLCVRPLERSGQTNLLSRWLESTSLTAAAVDYRDSVRTHCSEHGCNRKNAQAIAWYALEREYPAARARARSYGTREFHKSDQ